MRATPSSVSARQWALLPIPGATRTWLDTRTAGMITLVIGTWLTAGDRARSMHVMATLGTGEIGTYFDDIDISQRKGDAHG